MTELFSVYIDMPHNMHAQAGWFEVLVLGLLTAISLLELEDTYAAQFLPNVYGYKTILSSLI